MVAENVRELVGALLHQTAEQGLALGAEADAGHRNTDGGGHGAVAAKDRCGDAAEAGRRFFAVGGVAALTGLRQFLAQGKGIALSELVNALLRQDLELIKTATRLAA